MAQQSSARTYCQLCLKADPKNAKLATLQVTVKYESGKSKTFYACKDHADEGFQHWTAGDDVVDFEDKALK